MIFHTSDFHLDHENIIRFDNRPDKSIIEMNDRIVDTTNQYVGEKDWLVYHGDMILNKKIRTSDTYIDRMQYFFGRLRCKNIVYVGGNHDRIYTRRFGVYLPNWDFWNLFCTRFECRVCNTLFSPHGRFNLPYRCNDTSDCRKPDSIMPIYDIHPMGYELKLTSHICAIHNIPLELEGVLVVCTHYAHRVWNKSHHEKSNQLGASIQLYGHSHGSLPGIRNSFDVGFNIWNRPLSLLEILTKLIPEHNNRLFAIKN